MTETNQFQISRRNFCALLGAKFINVQGLGAELSISAGASAKALASLYMQRLNQAQSTEQPPIQVLDVADTPSDSPPQPRTFGSILSLHDTPRMEGSFYLNNMVAEISPIRPSYIIGLLPRPDWYDAVAQIGAQPIVRLEIPGQADDINELSRQLKKVPKGTRVLVRNEQNLVGETGKVPRLPEIAGKFDAKALRIVASYGCIPLTTPTSPEGLLQTIDGKTVVDQNGNPYYEPRYYDIYMQTLEKEGVFRDLPELEIGLHGYDFRFHPPAAGAAKMLERVTNFNRDIIVKYAGPRPIHLTECGFFLADVPIENIKYDEVGNAMFDLMGQNIPPELTQLQSGGYWIYAVQAQMPPHERPFTDSRFEKTALLQLITRSTGNKTELVSHRTPMFNAFLRSRQQEKVAA